MSSTDYRCPPRTASEVDRLAWLKSTRGQSEAWLQTQPCYRSFRDAVAYISGLADDEVLGAGLSDVKAGEVRRDIRELVETLANLRPLSSFKTDNKELYLQNHTLNKLQEAWWYMTRPNEDVKGALQMSAGMGTGWLVVEWDPDFYGPGRGDNALTVYGPHEILPVQLPKDADYQRAYAIHQVREMPIAMAHRKFPLLQNEIFADRQSPTWMKKGIEKVQQFLSPVLNMFGMGRDSLSPDPIFPTVDIVYTYVDDVSVNMTGSTVQMGMPNTSWSYEVPSMGTQIDSGLRDPTTGQPLMRDVTYDDARLYPMRRLMIWCETKLIYDDTSYWWHGKFPGVKFELDRWVWEAVGRPLTTDVLCMESSMTRLMRAIDDASNTRLSPPLQVNEDVISEDLAEEFNPRMPDQTLRFSGALVTDPIKPILPAAFYDVPAFIPQYVESLRSNIQRLLGVSDAQALMKARQLPGADTIEKIKEMAGPLIIGMTNGMEVSLQDLGDLWKWNVFQFLTLKRRLQILGDDAMMPEDFDFDPGTLIPSHLPGEETKDSGGNYKPSGKTSLERAKWYASQFYYFVVPGSIHRITQQTQKLLLLQLKKAGVPLDRWTLAKAFGIDNYGPEPAGTHNVMERVMAEQRMNEEAAARMAQAQGAGQQGPGRPNSGKKSPHIQSKDGGTRTTVSTS